MAEAIPTGYPGELLFYGVHFGGVSPLERAKFPCMSATWTQGRYTVFLLSLRDGKDGPLTPEGKP